MEENAERVIEDNTHRARIYSGLTVISGVMLPNFCNIDSDIYSGATNSSSRVITYIRASWNCYVQFRRKRGDDLNRGETG